MSIYITYLKNGVYPVIKIVRCLFTLIVESTENAIWLLSKRAYPVGGRLVRRLREDWLECLGLLMNLL